MGMFSGTLKWKLQNDLFFNPLVSQHAKLAYTEKQQLVGLHRRNLWNLEISERMRSKTVDLTTICNCKPRNLWILDYSTLQPKARLWIWSAENLKIWSPTNLIWHSARNLNSENLNTWESGLTRIWKSDRLQIWSDTRLGIWTQKIWNPGNLVWHKSENLIS